MSVFCRFKVENLPWFLRADQNEKNTQKRWDIKTLKVRSWTKLLYKTNLQGESKLKLVCSLQFPVNRVESRLVRLRLTLRPRYCCYKSFVPPVSLGQWSFIANKFDPRSPGVCWGGTKHRVHPMQTYFRPQKMSAVRRLSIPYPAKIEERLLKFKDFVGLTSSRPRGPAATNCPWISEDALYWSRLSLIKGFVSFRGITKTDPPLISVLISAKTLRRSYM